MKPSRIKDILEIILKKLPQDKEVRDALKNLATEVKFIDLPPVGSQQLTDIYALSANGAGSYKETRLKLAQWIKNNIGLCGQPLSLNESDFSAEKYILSNPPPYDIFVFNTLISDKTVVMPDVSQLNTGVYSQMPYVYNYSDYSVFLVDFDNNPIFTLPPKQAVLMILENNSTAGGVWWAPRPDVINLNGMSGQIGLISSDGTIEITDDTSGNSQDFSSWPMLRDGLLGGTNVSIVKDDTLKTATINFTGDIPVETGAQCGFSLEIPVTTTYAGVPVQDLILKPAPASISQNGFNVDLTTGEITCLTQGNYFPLWIMQSRTSGADNGFSYYVVKNGTQIIFSTQQSTQTNQNALQVIGFPVALNVGDTLKIQAVNVSPPYTVNLITQTAVFMMWPSANVLSANVDSGSWTPIPSNELNVDSVTVGKSFYRRVGNIVDITIPFTLNDVTDSSVSIDFDLPITANFTQADQAVLVGGSVYATPPNVADGGELNCEANFTEQKITCVFNISTGIGDYSGSITACYEVQS